MGIHIESGGVNSNTALVDTSGRLLTSAATNKQLKIAADSGNAFFINTEYISLTTTASYSGILYIKNTSTQYNLCISSLQVYGTQVAQWRAVRNPTTGTLISAGTSTTPKNMNFGSGTAFYGTAKYGVDGSTVTDGTTAGAGISNVGGLALDFAGSIILQTNNTMAIICKPSVAGTFSASMLAYFDTTVTS